jgi:hypothetical protein
MKLIATSSRTSRSRQTIVPSEPRNRPIECTLRPGTKRASGNSGRPCQSSYETAAVRR